MKNYLKIALCFAGCAVCVFFSVITFIGMLCRYQTAAAMPWAFAMCLFFFGALVLSIKLGEYYRTK